MSRIGRRFSRGDWVSHLPFSTIVFHRTVALYRNLEETVFPERATPAGLENSKTRVFDAIAAAGASARKAARFFSDSPPAIFESGAGHPPHGYFDGLPMPSDMDASRWNAASFADMGGGAVTAVVNAEDHLALFDRSNAPFSRQWRTLDSLAEKIGRIAPFAKSEEYGYLAANPDRVGTGMELFCDFSLFGLCVSREIEPSLNALERIGFEARPVFEPPQDDEESAFDAPGCRYWIHSARDAGTEADIVGRMDSVCRELARQEQNARLRLIETRSPQLEDFIMRSIAAGAFASWMSWGEAVDISLAILFAEDAGLLKLDSRLREKIAAVPESLSDSVLAGQAGDGADLKAVRAQRLKPLALPILEGVIR
ncbi:MAG: hypothetical protein IJS46_01870 [Kiritimatiellae bacterium]|nr:hypothetical protein [Kiritimatiellia bacterium]